MRKDSGKTREEMLLDAIGNLPEDMIAKAAEYSVSQKAEEQGERKEGRDSAFGEGELQEKKAGHKYWRMVCTGLAAAACLALVMIGGNKGGELFRQYTERSSIVSEKKEVEHQNAGKASKNSLENQSKEKMPEVKIWAGTAESEKESKSKTKKDGINNSSSEAVQERTDDDTAKGGKKELKEGVTRLLQVEEVDDGNGEKIPVIRLTFGNEGDKYTYSLYAQVSKIVSVTEDGVTKYVNLPDAACKSGGIAEFDTRRFAEVSWASNPVPEWETKRIEMFDIINISVQLENGREQEIGKFVIGVKGKKYYGVFKKS